MTETTASDTARQALALASTTPQQKTIHDLVARMGPQIEKALPRGLEVERFQRLILTELRRNPKLYECKAEGLLAAMLLSAQMGLEPGPMGHVYLVPFGKECVWLIGYKGLIELARRSGHLRDLHTGIVYEGDSFTFRRGTSPKVEHDEVPPSERGPVVCYYAVARLAGSGVQIERLWPEEIEAAKKRSPAGRKGEGPWISDYPSMARKTCVRRLGPYLPASPMLGRALEADEHPVAFVDGEVLAESDE